MAQDILVIFEIKSENLNEILGKIHSFLGLNLTFVLGRFYVPGYQPRSGLLTVVYPENVVYKMLSISTQPQWVNWDDWSYFFIRGFVWDVIIYLCLNFNQWWFG